MKWRRGNKPMVDETIEINHRPVFSTLEGFNAVEAVVVELLDQQFVCEVREEGIPPQRLFRFYKDYGDSWRYKI